RLHVIHESPFDFFPLNIFEPRRAREEERERESREQEPGSSSKIQLWICEER
ncbi:unnamed protein product, partial [Allacma fusca]